MRTALVLILGLLTMPGIYKLEMGELTIVFGEGGDRPKDFKADSEKTLMMVLTRKEKDQ